MATIKFRNAKGEWEEVNAAKLEYARKINGVPFDGSKDISIPVGYTDYRDLSFKPRINGHPLVEDRTSADLGLEPAKGSDDFYVTGAEKAKLGKLLVDFTVPTDAPSVTFAATDAGVLFSELNIKSLYIVAYTQSNATAASGRILTINGITSNYNNSSSNVTSGFLFQFSTHVACFMDLCVVGNCIIANSATYYSTSLNPPINNAIRSNVAILCGADSIDTISVEGAVSANIKAGSTIKIYRND